MHPRSWPKELLIGVRLTVALAAMVLIYTFVITGISQIAFNSNANGSLITVDGKIVGSTEIGQSCPHETLAPDGSLRITIDTRYFQGRLSYTTTPTPQPCNHATRRTPRAATSGHPIRCSSRPQRRPWRHTRPRVSTPVPIDLVTSDFTGFDPDISEAAALAQVNMVANARGLNPARSRRSSSRRCRAGSSGCSGSRWSTCSNSTWRSTRRRRASPADRFRA